MKDKILHVSIPDKKDHQPDKLPASSVQNTPQTGANFYQSLVEIGFIGCGEGTQDFSANYKSYSLETI